MLGMAQQEAGRTYKECMRLQGTRNDANDLKVMRCLWPVIIASSTYLQLPGLFFPVQAPRLGIKPH